jgi:nucleotide-binding universal stress UspA family protein
MKTILVLTDFSVGADHAAHYALKLAQKIKANLLLCHIIEQGGANPNTALAAWPIVNYSSFETESMIDLADLAGRLKKQVNKNVHPGDFEPLIEQYCKPGSITDTIDEIAKSRHLLMAVISMHNDEGLSALLFNNHASEIIEGANCPVLVVPYQAQFAGFRKISFATDLTHSGTEVLHSLYGLTKYFDSDILITHVADEEPEEPEEQSVIDRFFNNETAVKNYPRVSYQAIKSKSVTAGLDWLAEHTDIDLLVLVHRKRNFFQKIFAGSITQKMAGHLIKPMLVFPGSAVPETLPVF